MSHEQGYFFRLSIGKLNFWMLRFTPIPCSRYLAYPGHFALHRHQQRSQVVQSSVTASKRISNYLMLRQHVCHWVLVLAGVVYVPHCLASVIASTPATKYTYAIEFALTIYDAKSFTAVVSRARVSGIIARVSAHTLSYSRSYKKVHVRHVVENVNN